MLLCRITYESTREIKTYQIFESMPLYFIYLFFFWKEHKIRFEGATFLWFADGLIQPGRFHLQDVLNTNWLHMWRPSRLTATHSGLKYLVWIHAAPLLLQLKVCLRGDTVPRLFVVAKGGGGAAHTRMSWLLPRHSNRPCLQWSELNSWVLLALQLLQTYWRIASKQAGSSAAPLPPLSLSFPVKSYPELCSWDCLWTAH